MLIYVNQAAAIRTAQGRFGNEQDLAHAIIEGCGAEGSADCNDGGCHHCRPAAIMWGTGTGSEVMRRIARRWLAG